MREVRGIRVFHTLEKVTNPPAMLLLSLSLVVVGVLTAAGGADPPAIEAGSERLLKRNLKSMTTPPSRAT